MIEHFSHNFSSIIFVPLMILHMRMPHKICHFIGHNHIVLPIETHIQKFNIMFIAILEIQKLHGKVHSEFVLSKTGIVEPILRSFFIAVFVGVQFIGGLDCQKIEVLTIERLLVHPEANH